MAFSNGPRVVTNGAISLLDAADRNSYPGSGTTWQDMVGTFRTFTLTNGPTFDSANGGSIVFDGVDDYALYNDDIQTSLITVSVWVYKTSSSTNQGIANRSNTAWVLAQVSGSIQTFVSTVGAFIDTGYVIPLNEWTNIVFTYSGTGLSGSQIVYVNGTNVFSSASGSGNLPARIRGGTFTIGRYLGNNSYWGGRISQFQLYSRALSSSEVLQNYNTQKSRFGL